MDLKALSVAVFHFTTPPLSLHMTRNVGKKLPYHMEREPVRTGETEMETGSSEREPDWIV